MDTMPVTLISTQTLRPAREVSPVKLQLTAFDGMMKWTKYQRRVLFFRPAASDFAATVELLKSSLCEALVHFYPLAGRMIVVEDDEDNQAGLEIDCTGELSARLSEACTNAKLEDLGGFEPSEFNDNLAQIEGPEPRYPWNPETPLLFVQVTRFACGGLSLGVAFSHQVCDGVSFWHFMNSWGEIARTGELSLEPVVTYDYRPATRTDEELRQGAEAAGVRFRKTSAETDPAGSPPFMIKPEKLLVKLKKLSKASIEKLKSVAAEQSGGKNFSSFEVITAYFWRRMAMARFTSEDETSRTTMVALMNCRERLIKSLAKGYFGNAISTALPSCAVSELRRHGYWFGASLLHDTIFSAQKHADGLVGFLSKYDKQPNILHTKIIEPFHGFSMVVSSPRHPVFETEFGFGRAVGVTFGTNDLDEGKLYLFPAAAGDGSVDATVVLQPEAMERFNQQLSEDELLLS